MSKERIYTGLAITFAFLQTLLPTLFLSDTQTAIATVSLLTLASVFTILKQRISVEINNNATIFTWILIGLAVLGGLNEVLGSVHLSGALQGRLSTIVAALIGVLNITSKTFFPTEAGKVVQNVKDDLKEQETSK